MEFQYRNKFNIPNDIIIRMHENATSKNKFTKLYMLYNNMHHRFTGHMNINCLKYSISTPDSSTVVSLYAT